MGIYLVELVDDGDLEAWEIERIELVARATLEAASELIYRRIAVELDRTVDVTVAAPPGHGPAARAIECALAYRPDVRAL